MNYELPLSRLRPPVALDALAGHASCAGDVLHALARRPVAAVADGDVPPGQEAQEVAVVPHLSQARKRQAPRRLDYPDDVARRGRRSSEP